MDYLLRQQKLFDRSQLDKVFPVRSFDPESSLFWVAGNDDKSYLAASFLCAPLSGVDERGSSNLKAMLSADYPVDTMLTFNLISTTFIEPILSRYYNARANVMADSSNKVRADISRQFARNRIELYRKGAREPLDDQNPLLLKDFTMVVTMKIPVSKVPSEDEFEMVRTLAVSFESNLNTLRCMPSKMDHESYVMVMRAMLSPTKYPKTRLDRNRELNEQIFDFNDVVEIKRDHLIVNDRFVRSHSVQRFPEVQFLPQVSNLVGDPLGSINQIAEPFILTTHVYIPDYQDTRDKKRRDGAKLRTQAMGRWGQMFPRIRLKNENFQILLDSMEDGNRPIQIWTNLLLTSDNLDSLNKQTARVKPFYEHNNYMLKEDIFTQGPAWQQQFPMAITPSCVNFMYKFSTMTTEHACELIPVIADWKGNGGGANNIFYTKRGQVVLWDPFDSDSGFNGIIAGITGGGKSVLVNDIVMSVYTRGGLVRIIDSGYSYRKVTDMIGDEGEFIDFASEDNLILNPFTNVTDIQEDYFGISTILEYMAAPKEGLSDYQLSKLQEYVLEAWREFGNKLDITLLAAHISKRAKEVGCKDSQRMADQLFPYTQHGVNGRYFDGDATITFTKPWSCLELDSLQSKPDLRIIVLIMMVMQLKKDFISDDRNRKKILVIDEFWKFAKVEDGNAPTDPGVLKVIKFIDEAFRVFRKFSASIIISTQSLSDVGKGSPLLNNTEHIILLKQRREAIAYMKENKMLSISDYDYHMLKTLDKNGSKYSELFIYTTNRGSGFLRFKLDRATALLYTSDGQEESRIRQYEAQGMSILQAIQAYIDDEESDNQLLEASN